MGRARRPLLLSLLMTSSFCLLASIWCCLHLAEALANQQQVKSVVVTGGTHGNEYTGVWCVQHNCYDADRYPSLSISSMISNPEAVRVNQRFIDTDLNRQFGIDDLTSRKHDSVEAKQAAKLNELLGPKEDPKTDCIVDIHTTTSNMGLCLIVAESDRLMCQAAAYVSKRMPCHILMHAAPDRMHRRVVSSIAKHGITIEYGPVPQGIVRADAVEITAQALQYILEYLEIHNQDSKSAINGLLEHYDDYAVPCWRSAPAVEPGELSGKISWPTDSVLGNFPAALVHPDIQDRDWTVVRVGDPLFVRPDGSTINYHGSHGASVYVMFVNEGGYYYAESGTGIALAVRSAFDVLTGNFIECNDQHDNEECSFE